MFWPKGKEGKHNSHYGADCGADSFPGNIQKGADWEEPEEALTLQSEASTTLVEKFWVHTGKTPTRATMRTTRSQRKLVTSRSTRGQRSPS